MLPQILILAALTVAVFADVLFSSGERVLSYPTTDLASQFVYWRDFGFSHLRHGEIPLWNPHIFSGAPFFGGFQSALLYPPNLIFLLLPLGLALNWSIALHVFLAGTFTLLWLRNHVQHAAAALLGAVMVMFGGPYFLHIFAGHLPNLCTMVWVPLLFLAIEKIVARPSLGPALLGIFAASMAILAGHPQYVFYTAIAAGLYSCALIASAESKVQSLAALSLVCLATAAITAVQLWTGLQEAGETVRSIPLTFEHAARFAFPPENILTSVAPAFFGSLPDPVYWGRCNLFEMSVFMSVTGLVLAVYGAISTPRRLRWIAVFLIAVLAVLALGMHTPIFKFLYSCVPGFNKFRGISKFAYLAALFVVLLASLGFDRLLTEQHSPRWLMISTLSLAIAAGTFGLFLKSRASETGWQNVLSAVYKTGETCDDVAYPALFHDSNFIFRTRSDAAKSIFITAATFIAVALLLLAFKSSPRWRISLLALAMMELFVFARGSVTTFAFSSTKPAAVQKVLAENPGDYRIMNLSNPNSTMSMGGADIWGYDPGPMLRYVQFIAAAEGIAPDKVTQDFPLVHDHPCLSMARLRYLFAVQNGQDLVGETKGSLPHVLLVGHARVLTDRDQILSTVTATNFNAREEVILESAPQPAPEPLSDKSSVRLVDSSTDQLTIEATLEKPAILLVTDAYSRFWRVQPLENSAQQGYEIMPGDYWLRAIPLTAGCHRFRMQYAPTGFEIGKWISTAASLLYLACVAPALRRPRFLTKSTTH